MGIGAVYARFYQKYRHGLGVAYYRDRVRPRILKTPAVTGNDDLACEIHVMTSSRDWLDLIWALKTFYHFSNRRYALCIHDDGSLTQQHLETLGQHFPQARIIARPDADTRVLDQLKDYPRCLEFRRTNHLSPKVFDFAHYLQSDRMLLLDSDILFYREPHELLRRIDDADYVLNSVNADVSSAYTVEPAAVRERLGFELVDRFNSGLGLIHKASMNFDWIEEFLGLPGAIGHFWRIEQTMYALFSSKFGCELLPASYDVSLETIHPAGEDVQSRHYVGAIRHLMYGRGIRKLVKQGFLKAR